MKKLIGYFILGITLVFCMDRLSGLALDYARTHARSGPAAWMEDVCNRREFDVIVMGSSRACHHYVPSLMEEALQMSVANAGLEGTGIITMQGIAAMLLERYTPKAILYDVTPEFDFLTYAEDGDLTRYTRPLRPYARQKPVREIIRTVSEAEWIKTWSDLYRYNSLVPVVLYDFLSHGKNPHQGFKPLYGTMPPGSVKLRTNGSGSLHPIKAGLLQKLMETCNSKGIRLVFVASPKFGVQESGEFEALTHLAAEYGIPFVDFYADEAFSGHPELFHDAIHLNNEGAAVFTSTLCEALKNKRR